MKFKPYKTQNERVITFLITPHTTLYVLYTQRNFHFSTIFWLIGNFKGIPQKFRESNYAVSSRKEKFCRTIILYVDNRHLLKCSTAQRSFLFGSKEDIENT